jgi:biotin synthase
MPATIVRLAAGRNAMPESEQAMCFMAGANAVFTGDQMLTTPCALNKSSTLSFLTTLGSASFRFSMGRSNPYPTFFFLLHSLDFQDKTMMARWGLEGMQSFQQPSVVKKELGRLEGKAVAQSQGARLSS